MKVLVVSDTHGHAEQIKRVLDKTGAVAVSYTHLDVYKRQVPPVMVFR